MKAAWGLQVVCALATTAAVGGLVIAGTHLLAPRSLTAPPARSVARGAADGETTGAGSSPITACAKLNPAILGHTVRIQGRRVSSAEGEGGGGGGGNGLAMPATPYSLTYVLLSDGTGICRVTGISATEGDNDGEQMAIRVVVKEAPSGRIYGDAADAGP